MWNTTYYPKAADHINLEKQWYIVDAADKRLGRMASAIAVHIRGKNLATFSPSIDMGAYVVVVCFSEPFLSILIFTINQCLRWLSFGDVGHFLRALVICQRGWVVIF